METPPVCKNCTKNVGSYNSIMIDAPGMPSFEVCSWECLISEAQKAIEAKLNTKQ